MYSCRKENNGPIHVEILNQEMLFFLLCAPQSLLQWLGLN